MTFIYIYRLTHTVIYRHFTESALSAQRNKKITKKLHLHFFT